MSERKQMPKSKKNKSNKNKSKNQAPANTSGSVTRSGYSVRTMPFFGYRIRKTLPCYIASAGVTSGAGVAGAYVISANGMYDPDITGTGPQPMSFDQAMLFFNHYTVHKSTIRVTIQSNSTTLRASVGLFVSGSSSVTTGIEQLMENGDGAFQVLEYAGAFGGTATFTRTLDVGRFQDVANVMDDPNMRGDVASNPTEQAYFHIVVWNAASAAAVSIDFQALITFDATFHEPKKGPLS